MKWHKLNFVKNIMLQQWHERNKRGKMVLFVFFSCCCNTLLLIWESTTSGKKSNINDFKQKFQTSCAKDQAKLRNVYFSEETGVVIRQIFTDAFLVIKSILPSSLEHMTPSKCSVTN